MSKEKNNGKNQSHRWPRPHQVNIDINEFKNHLIMVLNIYHRASLQIKPDAVKPFEQWLDDLIEIL